MTKHTAGPWFVGEDDHNGQAIVRNDHIEIATCWHHCVGEIEQEMRGNAHIMAASLELLKVCEFLIRECTAEPYSPWSEARQMARIAIAKATGGD